MEKTTKLIIPMNVFLLPFFVAALGNTALTNAIRVSKRFWGVPKLSAASVIQNIAKHIQNTLPKIQQRSSVAFSGPIFENLTDSETKIRAHIWEGDF